jgi:hypothetical protein
MATYGLQTAAQARRADLLHLPRSLAAGFVALALLVGCATGPTELGKPLPVDRLSQLRPGTSMRDEVLATLGEPQGRGGGLLPTMPVHDLLLYESDTMEGTKMRMKMLIVFVNRSTGIYEGYMWFNSGMLLGPAS